MAVGDFSNQASNFNADYAQQQLRANSANAQYNAVQPPQPLLAKLQTTNARLIDVCGGLSNVADRLFGMTPEVAESASARGGEPVALYLIEDIEAKVSRLETILKRLEGRL